MHEIKGDLAVLRHAQRRIEKAVIENDIRLKSFLDEFKIDLKNRILPQIELAAQWSDRDLALLIYGLLKYGEGEWKHILEGLDFEKSEF